jgi:hypothetical protein
LLEENLVVKKVGLFATVFQRYDGTETYYFNNQLFNKFMYAIILSFIMFCLYSLQHQCPTKPKDVGEPHDASVMDDSIVQDRCSRKMHQRLAVNGGKSMV